MTPRRRWSSWDRTATWQQSAYRRCSVGRGRSRPPSRWARLTWRYGRARRRWHGGRRFSGVNRGVVVAGLPRVQDGAPLPGIVTPAGWLDRLPFWISDRRLDSVILP